MTTAAFRRGVALASASVGLLLAAPAAATGHDQYPDRLIKVIVPVPAGGAPDTLARIIAEKLQSKWNQPVVVENRPGFITNLGAEAVAKAEPDGYTLLLAPPPPFAINQHLYNNLRFDPAAFVPITVVASVPNVLVVRAGLAVSNVPELIALAKSQPGKLSYGSTGRGGTPHLSAEMLKALAGINIVHVPYKAAGQALNDMLGGTIDLAFANLIDVLPLVEGGRLKALAVGSAERSPFLRDVPVLAETIPGFVSTTWFAVAAPPKTPPEIAEKLSSAIATALKEPDAMAKLQGLKAAPILSTPSQAAEFFRGESERWRRAIVVTGIKPE